MKRGQSSMFDFFTKKAKGGDEIVSDNNDNSESPTELAEGSVTPTESLMESDKSSEEAARSGESLTEKERKMTLFQCLAAPMLEK